MSAAQFANVNVANVNAASDKHRVINETHQR